MKPEDCKLGVLISTSLNNLVFDDTEDEDDFLDFVVKTLDNQ